MPTLKGGQQARRLLLMVQAALFGEDDQRRPDWVAQSRPLVVCVAEAGVVAQ